MLTNIPEISVCIPVWNVEKYITQCLESVLSQTIIEKAEIIIVNDCTPDNSIQVINNIVEKNPQHKERIHIFTHEKNKGLAAARNTGLRNSKGKYVIQVDSDDWLEPNYLEELYIAAESINADISGCDYFKEEINKTTIIKEDLNKSNSDCLKYIMSICQGIIWTKLVKRKLFIQNDISWVEGLDMGEDLLICSKLFANATKIVNVAKPLYHYRNTNPNSYCKDSTKNQIKFKSLVSVTNNVIDYLSQWSPLYDNEFLIMKANIKKYCIFMSNKELRKYVYQIYPESDSILTLTAESFKRKFVLFLIAHKMYRLSNLVFRVMGR